MFTLLECTSPVFEMIYECNPVRSKFERRLEVNTCPLNIIYNPQAMKKVTEFFYKGRVHTSGKLHLLLSMCIHKNKCLLCKKICLIFLTL